MSIATTSEELAPPGVRPSVRRVRRGPMGLAGGHPPRVVDRAESDGGLRLRRTPRWQRRQVALLLALDAVLSLLAGVAALQVRFGAGSTTPYLLASLLFPVAWVGAVGLGRGYEPRFLGAGSEEFRRLFDASLRLFAVVAAAAYAFRLEVARGYVLLAFPVALALSLVGRIIAREILVRRRRVGRCSHSVVAVGSEASVRELVAAVSTESQAGFRLVGACVEEPDGDGTTGSAAREAAGRGRPRDVAGVPVLGGTGDVVAALRASGADTVAVTTSPRFGQEQLRRLSWELEGSGVDLLVAPRVTDVAGPRISIRPVAGLPLLHLEEPELTGGRRLLKGALDRSVAAVGLVLLAPVLLVVAAVVGLSSRGPVLFRQTRVGVAGTSFRMLKFRSMQADAEQRRAELDTVNVHGAGVLFKLRADPRVTRVGSFLRRWSLDELPQLVNVLRGNMSLVGPRPPLPAEVERYAEDARRRLLVKPGLTGLWQVSGRSDLSWEESVRLDLRYVENWTLALDLLIIWRTFAAVVRRRGAY